MYDWCEASRVTTNGVDGLSFIYDFCTNGVLKRGKTTPYFAQDVTQYGILVYDKC